MTMTNKELLYNLLKEAFFLLDDGDRQLMEQFHLSIPRFYALVHIADEPGISSSTLSERMLCDKSNITRLIKGLESDRYVERQPHETDGRAMRLYLTERGTAVYEQVLAAHQAYNNARMACVTEIEQDNLVDGLTKLNRRLRMALQPTKKELHLIA